MSQVDLFNPEMRGQLTSIDAIKTFVLAGRATITVRSRATNTRFTYRIRSPRTNNRNRPIWFVQLLSGADNENSYQYLGNIYGDHSYRHGRKSRITTDANSARAFNWFWSVIQSGNEALLRQAEVWHEGRCGRCGRKLTVPESIVSGFGPECIHKI